MRYDLTRARARAAIVTSIALALLLAMATTVAAAPRGHIARRHSLTVSDHANLHKTRRSGSTIYESGTATGTLPGTVTAVFHTGLTKVTGTVTFHSRSGSITMTVVGYARSIKSVVPFSGNLAVRSGTGRYRNALGSGTFHGTVNRRSWAASVFANARITY